jgi:hypothetical protein
MNVINLEEGLPMEKLFDLDVVVKKTERGYAPGDSVDPYYTGVFCTALCSVVCGW